MSFCYIPISAKASSFHNVRNFIRLYPYVCLFVFLALQPIVVVFNSPVAGFSLLVFEVS